MPLAIPDDSFQIGARCLLVLMGQRFLVSVIDAKPETLRLSFPVSDFPVDGMHVDLEFHDEQGYVSYETEVLHGPKELGDGMLVRRPPSVTRNQHRSSWRVPADFKAELKDHVHPRRTKVPVINLSAGGMLIRSSVPFEIGASVDVLLPIPQGDTHALIGQVMHLSQMEDARIETTLYGLRFVGGDPYVTQDITRYLWRRLRELHPEGLSHLRRTTDKISG